MKKILSRILVGAQEECYGSENKLKGVWVKFFQVVKDIEHLKRVKIALSKYFISSLTFTLYVTQRRVCRLS